MMLTQAPLEPMKDTRLNHLTLKTAFLLGWVTGKCCSKIHAQVANKVSKNKLANKGRLPKYVVSD